MVPSTPSFCHTISRAAGGYFNFLGHTDVKELALYAQDQIKAGNWLFNVGIRGDLYNGLTIARQAEPRVGVSYTVKPTSTVLRLSYARTLESPFNENLVLSSQGCLSDVLAPLLLCTPGVSGTLSPASTTSFTPACNRPSARTSSSAANTSGSTPTTPSTSACSATRPSRSPSIGTTRRFRASQYAPMFRTIHNFSAFVVMSSVAARFFPRRSQVQVRPSASVVFPFRIDHDERFNQTTHCTVSDSRTNTLRGSAFNWRFDSGLTAGSVPCYNVTEPNSRCNPANGGPSITINGQPGIDLSGLTPDQQFQAGLTCNGIKATPFAGIPGNQCLASQLTSKLVSIPAPGTENDDKNPPRIAPRNLFDASVGQDNLFHGDRYKWSLRLTAVNITNKYALYNFLSTFSGTHYVTPRAMTAEVGFHF